jgi:hypothetical protein
VQHSNFSGAHINDANPTVLVALRMADRGLREPSREEMNANDGTRARTHEVNQTDFQYVLGDCPGSRVTLKAARDHIHLTGL